MFSLLGYLGMLAYLILLQKEQTNETLSIRKFQLAEHLNKCIHSVARKHAKYSLAENSVLWLYFIKTGKINGRHLSVFCGENPNGKTAHIIIKFADG